MLDRWHKQGNLVKIRLGFTAEPLGNGVVSPVNDGEERDDVLFEAYDYQPTEDFNPAAGTNKKAWPEAASNYTMSTSPHWTEVYGSTLLGSVKQATTTAATAFFQCLTI